jgi:hypothetical protein
MRNSTLSLVLGLAVGLYTIKTNNRLLLPIDISNFVVQVACQIVSRLVLARTFVVRTLVLCERDVW